MAFNTLAARDEREWYDCGKENNKGLSEIYRFYLQTGGRGEEENIVTKDIETSVLANVIMGTHHGILLEWYMKQDEIDGVQLARAFRTVMLSGILNNKGERKTVKKERGQHRR